MATSNTSSGRSGAPLLIIAIAIGVIIVWALINRDDKVRLCTVGPCPQPTVSATPFR